MALGAACDRARVFQGATALHSQSAEGLHLDMHGLLDVITLATTYAVRAAASILAKDVEQCGHTSLAMWFCAMCA